MVKSQSRTLHIGRRSWQWDWPCFSWYLAGLLRLSGKQERTQTYQQEGKQQAKRKQLAILKEHSIVPTEMSTSHQWESQSWNMTGKLMRLGRHLVEREGNIRKVSSIPCFLYNKGQVTPAAFFIAYLTFSQISPSHWKLCYFEEEHEKVARHSHKMWLSNLHFYCHFLLADGDFKDQLGREGCGPNSISNLTQWWPVVFIWKSVKIPSH